MLQRIQTVFLALAVVLGIALYFFPIYSFMPVATASDTTLYTFRLTGVVTLKGDVVTVLYKPLFSAALLAFVNLILIITIFRYKNRKQQMQFGKVAAVLLFVFVLLVIKESYNLGNVAGTDHALHLSVFSALPVVQMVLIFLGVNFIHKDEELVRSADRLR